MPEPRRRASFLLVSEQQLLKAWGRELRRMFGAMPYHVGSSLKRADWRDVDVRLLLDDEPYRRLAESVHLDLLHLSVSLWGQQVTGLPIDFQVQCRDCANADYPSKNGHWRSAIGIEAHDRDERRTPDPHPPTERNDP